MDRRRRAGWGATVLASMVFCVQGVGCRSMRSEVPPSKPFVTTPGSKPQVGFGSDPHPDTAAAGGVYGPNGLLPANQGMGSPGALPQYGAPGTNPMQGSNPGQGGMPLAPR